MFNFIYLQKVNNHRFIISLYFYITRQIIDNSLSLVYLQKNFQIIKKKES